MKRTVIWNSKENSYVNKYKGIYFAFAVIFVILMVCASISFLFVDWNESGHSFETEDIFIGLFFNLILVFFYILGFVLIKSGLQALKFDNHVVLTYYPMKEINKYIGEINPNEVVFSDTNCIVTSNSKFGFSVLSTIFCLTHSFDFETLFDKLELVE